MGMDVANGDSVSVGGSKHILLLVDSSQSFSYKYGMWGSPLEILY